MPSATLLLQTSWPTLHPLMLLTTLAWPASVGEWVLWLIASAAALEKLYGWIFGGTSKRLDKLEAAVRDFVPEPDIKAKHEELGRQIADNQAKIKTQHDRTEDAINALNGRVQTLEQHNSNLTLLPGEVSNLKTDHRVLASKVDGLVQSVQGLDRKQDEHFSKLMDAVSNLSYTRGQLSSQRRQGPPQD